MDVGIKLITNNYYLRLQAIVFASQIPLPTLMARSLLNIAASDSASIRDI